jgi:type IX secretion system PorP/SprF family membrane protein
LFLLSPASIGVNGGLNAFVGHKAQWTGLNNAPENTYLTIDGLLTKSMGLGLSLNQQKMGIFNISNVGVSYAYRIAFSDMQALSFGVSVNFVQNIINTTGLYEEELSDPTLLSNKFNQSLFYTGFSAQYRLKGLCVDISSPVIFSAQEKKLFQTNYLYVSYDFYFGNNVWRLQPSTLAKYMTYCPFQIDGNILLDWNGLVWTQVSYRSNKEMFFGAGVFVKYIGIGYAYELNFKPASYFSNGSHEIVVFLDFPITMSKKEPLYFDGRRRNSWN